MLRLNLQEVSIFPTSQFLISSADSFIRQLAELFDQFRSPSLNLFQAVFILDQVGCLCLHTVFQVWPDVGVKNHHEVLFVQFFKVPPDHPHHCLSFSGRLYTLFL